MWQYLFIKCSLDVSKYANNFLWLLKIKTQFFFSFFGHPTAYGVLRIGIRYESCSNTGTPNLCLIAPEMPPILLHCSGNSKNTILKNCSGVPVVAQQKRIRLGSMRMLIRSLVSLSGLRIQCCRELWCRQRRGSDLAWLWLWCRPAATALIQLLAWEPPYASGAALKKRQKGKNLFRECVPLTVDLLIQRFVLHLCRTTLMNWKLIECRLEGFSPRILGGLSCGKGKKRSFWIDI